MKLNRAAYVKLIEEDISWLRQQPDTLERKHIEAVLRQSPGVEYEVREELAAAERVIAAVARLRRERDAQGAAPIGETWGAIYSELDQALDALPRKIEGWPGVTAVAARLAGAAGTPFDVPPHPEQNLMLTQNQIILDALRFWEAKGSLSAWTTEMIAAVRASVAAAPLQPLAGTGPIRVAVTMTEEEYLRQIREHLLALDKLRGIESDPMLVTAGMTRGTL